MGIQMTQKAEPLSASACLLCQGQCSSDWKKHNCTREMKPKIGERVLKEHLAALNELKSLALDQLYPRDMRELAWARPTCWYWRVFSEVGRGYGSLQDIHTVAVVLGSTRWCQPSWRLLFSYQVLATLNNL